MRKLKNRYIVGGLLGALAGFGFAFLDDMELAAAQAHRSRTHKPAPSTWAVWAVLGAGSGSVLACLPRVLRFMARHPFLSLAALCLVGNKSLWDGVDGVEHRISTTGLGSSPSLQSAARSCYQSMPATADDIMGIGESQ